MGDAPLMVFRSHVAGRNADVMILPGRVEWSCAGRHPVTETIPISAISSVSTGTAGFFKWKAVVTTNDNKVEFRVGRATAEQAAALLSQLVALHAPLTTNEKQPVAKDGVAAELINLKWLLDAGILTENDFAELRARLLGF
jgi:hypothetical protein